MNSSDRIEKSVTLRAPISRVWRAIADAAEFGRWFGFTLEGKFEPGMRMKGTFNGIRDEAALIEQQQRLGLKASKVKLPDNAVFCTVEAQEISIGQESDPQV